MGAVVEAKRQGLPVKLGLEVDYVGERQDELAGALEPYPWDYLLGSVHWIDGLAVDQEPGLWASERRGRGVAAVLRGAGGARRIGPRRRARPPRPGEDLRPAARRAGIEYPALEGVALEISTAGLHKPVGELYPDAAFLAAARLPITLASDAHVPQNVGRDFDRAVELARAAGYETVTVFESRQARQEPLG